jgi:hypothetical protein
MEEGMRSRRKSADRFHTVRSQLVRVPALSAVATRLGTIGGRFATGRKRWLWL